MEREPSELDAIQQWLGRLITDPEGLGPALAAEGDPEGRALAALVRGDRSLSAADRLAVYANAYFVRLHDCLRDDFGALARALGPEAFHDLVRTYLMMHPSTSPSLRHAGAHLARHLSDEPFAGIFSRRCPYAADLAALEWAMTEAFYAPDGPVLAREALSDLAPDAWADLRFETSSSLRLLACAWPVHTVRARFEREVDQDWEEAPALVAAPTSLCVFRLHERVRYRAISRSELEALRGASGGESFAAICERLIDAVGEAEAPRRATAFLNSWLSDGLLAGRL